MVKRLSFRCSDGQLLLVSKFSQVVALVEDFLPTGARVAYIPTARNVYAEQRPDTTAMLLVERLYRMTVVGLENARGRDLDRVFRQNDAIFITGGDPWYLARHAKASGFYDVLPGVLASGVKFVGASAGAMIVGPTLEPARGIEPLEEPAAPAATAAITPYLVLPHADRYEAAYALLRRRFTDVPLVMLRDDQAVLDLDRVPILATVAGESTSWRRCFD
jgi:dipeptidase E